MVLNRLVNALWQSEKKPKPTPGAYSSGGYHGGVDGSSIQRELPNTTFGLALASTVSVFGGKAMMVRMGGVENMEWQLKTANDVIISHSRDRNPRHPLARAIQQVYNDQYNSFFALVEQSRCVWGETFVEKVANPYGVPTGLYWLNNLGMYFNAPRGVIEWFRYTSPGGGMVSYEPYEIGYSIAIKSPSDDLRGISPMELALQTINLDNNSTQFLLSYWRNMARPGFIASPKEGVYTQEDMDLTAAWIAGNLQGIRKAGKPVVLPKGVDITTLDYDDPEIQTEARRTLQREILVAFGVPPAVIGDTEDTGYKPSEENQYWLYANTIIPECTGIEKWVNADLLPFFEPDTESYFEFDTSPYDRVTEADKAQQNLLEQRYKSGAIDYFTYQLESGKEKPSERWKEAYYVESLGTPVPADEYAGLWRYNIQTPPTGYTPPTIEPAVTPQTAQTTQADEVLTPEDPTKDLGEPLFVGLNLADSPDIIGLQKEVMSLAPDPSVKWTHPNDYHITLLQAPATDETIVQAFLEALKELPIPELNLKLGSLYAFDRMGKHALTSLVRRNQALLDYQAQLYDLAQEFGIQCQSRFTASQYKPHVTLAYIPEHMRQVTYQGKITVTPVGVKCDYGGESLWRSWDTDAAEVEPPLDASAMTEELKTFKAFAKIHGAVKAQRFAFHAIPVSLGDALKYRVSRGDSAATLVETTLKAMEGEYDAHTAEYAKSLSALPIDTNTAIRAVVSHYAGILAAKAIGDTRSRFEAELTRQMLRAYNENVKRSVFERNMGILLNKYAEKALYDGFADAGIADFDLDDTEDDEAIEARQWLDRFLDDQSSYISGVADVLYADDAITEDEIKDYKGELWWTGSVLPAYNYALTTASKNARLKWVFDPSKEHCGSCEVLNGIVLTAKRWQSEGIEPGSRELDCWGGLCGCKFEPTNEKKYRGKLPRWKFKAVVHMH